MNNELPFKVRCIDASFNSRLTEGKEYEVKHITYEYCEEYYQVHNNDGVLEFCFSKRFEIVKTPKVGHKFSVGDKVVINNISDDFVSSNDKNVKVGDVATVVRVNNGKGYNTKLSNPNWKRGWWFSRNDLSLVEGENPLTHQEVIQAILDGKEVEIQYADGTWHSFSTHSTTLHQFINLNFRLKPSPSLEEKRKAIIKKLLETKVAVLCKCWDDDDVDYIGKVFVAVTSVADGYTYPYMNNEFTYQCAFAIDDNGNEITNV